MNERSTFVIGVLILGFYAWNLASLKISNFRLPSVSRLHRFSCDSASNFKERLPISLPRHPDLFSGKLDNGLSIHVLPNKSPGNWFEAYLEILAGSCWELESQRGLAHLLEHCMYMGSPNRLSLSGTGSKTNAFTDFQHTAFFACCPTFDSFNRDMLPRALNALHDVFLKDIYPSRLEQERAAVLSESSMINKMDYRVESEVIRSTHPENLMSSRLPIGLEKVVESCSLSDIHKFHDTHYTPQNANLYIVGDVTVDNALKYATQVFGDLKEDKDRLQQLKDSGEYPFPSLNNINRHFPPIIHLWSKESARTVKEQSNNSVSFAVDTVAKSLPTPSIFSHDLLDAVSFHMVYKRPLVPSKDVASLKKFILETMIVAMYQVRLGILARENPIFTWTNFNACPSVRDACLVSNLDIVSSPENWKQALLISLLEIRRLGVFGVSHQELERLKPSILSEFEKMLFVNYQTSENLMKELMNSIASGDTFMQPEEKLSIMTEIVEDITLEEINKAAKDVCEHVSHVNVEEGVVPSSMLLCKPTKFKDGQSFEVTKDEILDVFQQSQRMEIEPVLDIEVPVTLLSEQQMTKLQNSKECMTGVDSNNLSTSLLKLVDHHCGSGDSSATSQQRTTSNGIRINTLNTTNLHMNQVKLIFSGGRLAETLGSYGAAVLAALTMQEGGACGNFSREQIELFCFSHMIEVSFVSHLDHLEVNFDMPPDRLNLSDDGTLSSMEAAFQLIHLLLTDFVFEKSAFQRACNAARKECSERANGLETRCLDLLGAEISSHDPRYMYPSHETISQLTLEKDIIPYVQSVMCPENLEISIVSSNHVATVNQLVDKYLETIPASKRTPSNLDPFHFRPLGLQKPLILHLNDSEPRAMAYIAGVAPNLWGLDQFGRCLNDTLKSFYPLYSIQRDYQKHPLFGFTLLSIVKEMLSLQLFDTLREKHRLTYDARFDFKGMNFQWGGHYLVSVTSSPSQIMKSVDVCWDTLINTRKNYNWISSTLHSCKNIFLRNQRDSSWVSQIAFSNWGSMIPCHHLSWWSDLSKIVSSIEHNDVIALLDYLQPGEDHVTTCIGVSSPASQS